MNAIDVTARGLAQQALQSGSSLATPEGAARVGTADGGTVQDAIGFASVAALLGSQSAARGPAAPWRGGGYYYSEAPADAVDHHLTTAGGIKLYVEPQVPMLGFAAGAFGARTLDPGDVGDPQAESANAAANNIAIQAAIDAAAARNWDVLFEAGTYCYSTEFACEAPIGIIGRGVSATVFQPDSAYSGWFMGFTEINYNDGDANGDYTQDRSAARFRHFSVQARGGRSGSAQHGIRFIGRCDRMTFECVLFVYLVGTAIHFGHANGPVTTVAYARECMISNVEARFCGDDADARPVFVFDNYGTVPGQDGCNLVVANRLWATCPYHTALKIVNNNPGGAQVRKMAFNNTLIHGAAAFEPVPVTDAPLVHIVGFVTLSVFRDLWLNSHYTGQYAVQAEANASGTPRLISFEGGNIALGDGHGFNFLGGYGYTVDFQYWGQVGTGVSVGPAVTGAVTIGSGTGQVPSLGIAPGLEKLVNAGLASSPSLPLRSERFVLGPNGTAPSVNYTVGNPNGNVTANAGSLALNIGAAGQLNSSTMAVKVSGATSSGWAYVQEVIGGTSAQRPSSPTANQLFADLDRQRHVSYIGGAWREPVRWVAAPATATSTGKTGDVAADANYMYLCQPDNTWRRTALASW